MKIICDTTFLDGRDRLEKDEVRVVDDERGRYFVDQKWAHEAGGSTGELFTAGDVTLTVQDTAHTQETNHG